MHTSIFSPVALFAFLFFTCSNSLPQPDALRDGKNGIEARQMPPTMTHGGGPPLGMPSKGSSPEEWEAWLASMGWTERRFGGRHGHTTGGGDDQTMETPAPQVLDAVVPDASVVAPPAATDTSSADSDGDLSKRRWRHHRYESASGNGGFNEFPKPTGTSEVVPPAPTGTGSTDGEDLSKRYFAHHGDQKPGGGFSLTSSAPLPTIT